MVLLDGRNCRICDRPARLYGLRNLDNGYTGWCQMCQLHYRQNHVFWTLRCLCRPVQSSRGARGVFFSKDMRVIIVIWLFGSQRWIEQVAQRRLWEGILYANGPNYVREERDDREASDTSDSDSEYDEYRPYVNPMWSLASFTSSDSDGPRVLVLDFLGDYQKKRRRV